MDVSIDTFVFYSNHVGFKYAWVIINIGTNKIFIYYTFHEYVLKPIGIFLNMFVVNPGLEQDVITIDL